MLFSSGRARPFSLTPILGLLLALALPARGEIPWEALRNPVYEQPGWSVKDACMIRKGEYTYIIGSAFFWDRGRERSHIFGVKTRDFRTFSEPLFLWSGEAEGWTGLCSPNVSEVDGKYYLTYNSWGDRHPNGNRNRALYAVSDDLENWDPHRPVGWNLMEGTSIIDAALTHHGARWYLVWQEWKVDDTRVKRNRVAWSRDLDGDFAPAANERYIEPIMANGVSNHLIGENFEFIEIDGVWHLLSTDYRPHQPYLYRMEGDPADPESWTRWVDGQVLRVPSEHFNTNYVANAAFLADWRDMDGHFYLLYAGSTESQSHDGRGDNRLGLARSKDLVHWEAPGDGSPFIDWDALRNPIYEHEGWSTKDACMEYRDGWFYLFFSAFYHDRGRERSHVTGVRTRDFKTFSEPLFMWDGREDGWIGMCSPNVMRRGETWVMTFNSWGDQEGRPNQLFYATSPDLMDWSEARPLAPEVTVKDGAPTRAIDAAVTFYDKRWYLVWKEGRPHVTRMAIAPDLDGPWTMIPPDGNPDILMYDERSIGLTHENFDFVVFEGWRYLVSTDYKPHIPVLYRQAAFDPESPADWMYWHRGAPVHVPEQWFNTNHRANAVSFTNWTHFDGHIYMIYAGRTEGESHAGRGDNRLGLARSRNLAHWDVPGPHDH